MPTLSWIGKKAVENHHREVPFHLLKELPELSVGDPGSGNLLVEGDNLLALKALLPYYAGQVKCIYIDPPYNTGNEGWIYNDNVNSPEIRKWLGKVVGSELEDLTRHDKWLCMMYPRLKLLKKFLKQDGGIFISIDSNEEAHLRVLLDEIFGSNNYRNTFIVSRIKKNIKERDKVKAVNFGHNSVIFYANSKDTLIVPPTREHKKDIRWHAFDAPGIRTTMQYELFGHKPPNRRHWMYSEDRANDLIEKGLLRANPKTGKPQYRIDESSETLLDTVWTDIQEAGFSWSFPYGEKNPFLIKRIINMLCGKDDIVLDSFSGSGTTGHAVQLLNNIDNGGRRFVLIELDSKICRTVTSERLRQISVGYNTPNGELVSGIGNGFRFSVIDDALFDEKGNIRKTVRFADLARHVYFTETGEPLHKQAKPSNPLIGICRDIGVYLLYNGILKDKTPDGGNVLTTAVLAHLPNHKGPKVIYGTACRLGVNRLRQEKITFKQLPYKIRVDAL